MQPCEPEPGVLRHTQGLFFLSSPGGLGQEQPPQWASHAVPAEHGRAAGKGRGLVLGHRTPAPQERSRKICWALTAGDAATVRGQVTEPAHPLQGEDQASPGQESTPSSSRFRDPAPLRDQAAQMGAHPPTPTQL